MKIYTKQGDGGLTRLGNGVQLPKADGVFDALGDLDELNAYLGKITSNHCDTKLLRKIQGQLLEIGAELSLSKSAYDNISADIVLLEESIDKFQESLSPLKYFILPGGERDSADLHFARTICRRAERTVVRHFNNLKSQQVPFNGNVVIYLNRLSDLLFTMARYYNDYGTADVIWKK
jgi:cob(I)alamin adenosyltransferase